MMKAILPAKLLLRNLYRTLSCRSSWDSILEIDQRCMSDLKWWLQSISSWNGNPLLPADKPVVQISTDASGTGWGGACGNIEASGTWSKDVSFRPSNYRELLAVYKTIISLREVLKGKTVQVMSDNITTVAYINKLGGTSSIMSDLMTTIFMAAHELKIDLTAKYLAGVQNTHADRLSRILTPYEWQLHPAVFRALNNMWGPHSIDRFASELTTQLPRYNSLFWDPHTEAVDAMSQPWQGENNYINPPFWMLGKIVKKLRRDGASATVIAPWWTAQPWFAELRSMQVHAPFLIKSSHRTMIRRSGLPEPLKNHRWKIYAWRLCGKKDCRV